MKPAFWVFSKKIHSREFSFRCYEALNRILINSTVCLKRFFFNLVFFFLFTFEDAYNECAHICLSAWQSVILAVYLGFCLSSSVAGTECSPQRSS